MSDSINIRTVVEWSTQDIEKLINTQSVYAVREPLWKEAFAYYNSHNERKLSMGCYPCFGKVLQFIMLQKIKALEK